MTVINFPKNNILNPVLKTILCPFHKESTPSCSVDYVKDKFYCFSCGELGNLAKLNKKIQEKSQ